VLSYAAAILFDAMKNCLKGTALSQGVMFGLLLFIIQTLPSRDVIFTSMTYPLGFHTGSFLDSSIGYPVLGILFVRIWNM
jgi:hypothetical protein